MEERRKRTLILRALAAACCLMIMIGCSSVRPPYSANGSMQRVLEEAHDLLGTSYCSRGNTPDCFDCSGYTSWCYGKIGVTLPRTSSDQYAIGTSIPRSQLMAGDLVFFRTVARTISHVGICVDGRRFIHASTSSGVMVSRFDDAYWKPRYVGARRLK